MTSNDLLRTIRGTETEKTSTFATVTSISSGNVYVQFYGEEEPSQKPYKRVSTYSPSVGDKVVIQKIGTSYMIMGKVV